MINHTITNITLSSKEYNQYARHIILDEIGIQGQQRLKQAKILIVGAGGLACPCIIYLVACGIGYLGIIDNDIVTLSNLQRQILYGNQDINKMKTEVAQKKIKQFHNNCIIKIYPVEFTNHNATDLVKNYDIIIDASDNFKTRYIIDDICYKLHKTHIYGAIQNFEGQISVFNYKSGPRYSDLYPQHLSLNNYSCNTQGVLGVLPGIIGLLQATEAIKIIIGVGHILSGSMIIYNAHSMNFRTIYIRKIPKYLKGRHDTDIKSKGLNTNYVSVSELKSINSNDATIIDIRQKVEFDKQHIQNAINIPLKLMSNNYNINTMKEYSKHGLIIIYCNENSRSIIASEILYRHKIKHLRLKNGLNGWVKEHNI